LSESVNFNGTLFENSLRAGLAVSGVTSALQRSCNDQGKAKVRGEAGSRGNGTG
jgi:hypothetical protein